MPVNLSIKNVPDDVAEKLRKRAARHHRSLQGELMAILEESLAERRVLTPAELLSEVQATGLKTPEESAIIIRKERDARSRR
ncbi:MAG: Arc family DNA-binding protein [Thermodesulfobacteriota bacterium]